VFLANILQFANGYLVMGIVSVSRKRTPLSRCDICH